ANLGDRNRRLDIKINDEEVRSGKPHPWNEPSGHEYPNDQATRNSQDTWLSFAWKPDDRITVSMLYDPGRFSSWALIVTKTFDGPMALWRLANEQLDDDQGTRVEFEIYRIHEDGRPGLYKR